MTSAPPLSALWTGVLALLLAGAARAEGPEPGRATAPGETTLRGRDDTEVRVLQVVASELGRLAVGWEQRKDGARVSLGVTRVGAQNSMRGYRCEDEACAEGRAQLAAWLKSDWRAYDMRAGFDATWVAQERPADARAEGRDRVELTAADGERVVVELVRERNKRMNQFGTRSLVPRVIVTGWGQSREGSLGWVEGAWLERVVLRGRDVIVVGAGEDFSPRDEDEDLKLLRFTLAPEGEEPVVRYVRPAGFTPDGARFTWIVVRARRVGSTVRPVAATALTADVRTGEIVRRHPVDGASRLLPDVKVAGSLAGVLEDGDGGSMSAAYGAVPQTKRGARPYQATAVPGSCKRPDRAVIRFSRAGDDARFGRLVGPCPATLHPVYLLHHGVGVATVAVDEEGLQHVAVGRDPAVELASLPPTKPAPPPLPQPWGWLDTDPLTGAVPPHPTLGVRRSSDVERRIRELIAARARAAGFAPSDAELDEWMKRSGYDRIEDAERRAAQRRSIGRVLASARYAIERGWVEPPEVTEADVAAQRDKRYRVELGVRVVEVSTRIFGREEAFAHAKKIARAARAGEDLGALGDRYGWEKYGDLETVTLRLRNKDDPRFDARPGDVLGPVEDRSKVRVTRVESRTVSGDESAETLRKLARLAAMTDLWVTLPGLLVERGVLRTRFSGTAPPWPEGLAPPVGEGAPLRAFGYDPQPTLIVHADGAVTTYEGTPLDVDRLTREWRASERRDAALLVFGDARAPASALREALAAARAAEVSHVSLRLAGRRHVVLVLAGTREPREEVVLRKGTLLFGPAGEARPMRAAAFADTLAERPRGLSFSPIGLRVDADVPLQDVVDVALIVGEVPGTLWMAP